MFSQGKLRRGARGLVFLLSIYLGSGITPARAEGEISLVTGEFPPFTSENLPNGGMITELVTTVFYSLGYSPTVTYLPWKRGYQDTLDLKFIGTFPYSYSEARAREVHYSDPLRENDVYLFVRADSDMEYSSLDDLAGARFCAALGYNIFPSIQEAVNRKLVSLITVREMGNCIRMMEIGRADAVFLSEDAGWRIIEAEAGTRRHHRMLPNPIDTAREYLVVSRQYPGALDLIDEFNQELQRFAKTDAYQLLINKHHRDPEH